MKRASTVEEYIRNAEQWRDELVRLRDILCATELEETVKWGAPCYTFAGSNVVGLASFKSYFGLWFHQGALLRDEKKVLVNAQQGTTRALRQWRMHSVGDIKPRIVKAYVREAIQLVRDGQRIRPRRKKRLVMPPELTAALAANPKAQKEFAEFRTGIQREYADYVANAKRADTKERRLEKIMPMIAAGIGLNDKYRQSR